MIAQIRYVALSPAARAVRVVIAVHASACGVLVADDAPVVHLVVLSDWSGEGSGAQPAHAWHRRRRQLQRRLRLGRHSRGGWKERCLTTSCEHGPWLGRRLSFCS